MESPHESGITSASQTAEPVDDQAHTMVTKDWDGGASPTVIAASDSNLTDVLTPTSAGLADGARQRSSAKEDVSKSAPRSWSAKAAGSPTSHSASVAQQSGEHHCTGADESSLNLSLTNTRQLPTETSAPLCKLEEGPVASHAVLEQNEFLSHDSPSNVQFQREAHTPITQAATLESGSGSASAPAHMAQQGLQALSARVHSIWETPRVWAENVFAPHQPQLATVVENAVAANTAASSSMTGTALHSKPSSGALHAEALKASEFTERGSLMESSEARVFLTTVVKGSSGGELNA